MKSTIMNISLFFALVFCTTTYADVVKEQDGVCYDEESPQYSTMSGQATFTSLQACLAAVSANGKRNVLATYYKGIEPKLWQVSATNALSNAQQELAAKSMSTLSEVERTGLKAKEQEKQVADDTVKNLYGFNFNPALTMLFYVGDDYLDDISVETRTIEGESKNYVRVGKSVSTQLAVMLESHYFFEGKLSGRTFGHGPYISTNLATQEGNEIFSILSFGYMIGLAGEDGTSFNIGLGGFVDTDVKKLRNGLKDGSETTFVNSKDLYDKTDQEGVILSFSATF